MTTTNNPKRDWDAINGVVEKLCAAPPADMQKRARDIGLIVSVRGADAFMLELPGGTQLATNRFGAESFILGYAKGLIDRRASKARADE